MNLTQDIYKELNNYFTHPHFKSGPDAPRPETLESLAESYKMIGNHIKTLKEQQDEVKAKIIKEMDRTRKDNILAGAYTIHYKPISKSYFDAKALRKDYPELDTAYTKNRTELYFSIK